MTTLRRAWGASKEERTLSTSNSSEASRHDVVDVDEPRDVLPPSLGVLALHNKLCGGLLDGANSRHEARIFLSTFATPESFIIPPHTR